MVAQRWGHWLMTLIQVSISDPSLGWSIRMNFHFWTSTGWTSFRTIEWKPEIQTLTEDFGLMFFSTRIWESNVSLILDRPKNTSSRGHTSTPTHANNILMYITSLKYLPSKVGVESRCWQDSKHNKNVNVWDRHQQQWLPVQGSRGVRCKDPISLLGCFKTDINFRNIVNTWSLKICQIWVTHWGHSFRLLKFYYYPKSRQESNDSLHRLTRAFCQTKSPLGWKGAYIYIPTQIINYLPSLYHTVQNCNTKTHLLLGQIRQRKCMQRTEDMRTITAQKGGIRFAEAVLSENNTGFQRFTSIMLQRSSTLPSLLNSHLADCTWSLTIGPKVVIQEVLGCRRLDQGRRWEYSRSPNRSVWLPSKVHVVEALVQYQDKLWIVQSW